MSFTTVDKPVAGVRGAARPSDAELKQAMGQINKSRAVAFDHVYPSRKLSQTMAWRTRRWLAEVGGVEPQALASRTVEVEGGFQVQIWKVEQ